MRAFLTRRCTEIFKNIPQAASLISRWVCSRNRCKIALRSSFARRLFQESLSRRVLFNFAKARVKNAFEKGFWIQWPPPTGTQSRISPSCSINCCFIFKIKGTSLKIEEECCFSCPWQFKVTIGANDIKQSNQSIRCYSRMGWSSCLLIK